MKKDLRLALLFPLLVMVLLAAAALPLGALAQDGNPPPTGATPLGSAEPGEANSTPTPTPTATLLAPTAETAPTPAPDEGISQPADTEIVVLDSAGEEVLDVHRRGVEVPARRPLGEPEPRHQVDPLAAEVVVDPRQLLVQLGPDRADLAGLAAPEDVVQLGQRRAGAIRGDGPIPMIATKDIAATVADHLAQRDFTGSSVKYLLGQRDLTMSEATAVVGTKIGKPGLAYVMFPYDEAEKALVSAGLSADVSRLYIEMSRAFNEGRVGTGLTRTHENTTPTSIARI